MQCIERSVSGDALGAFVWGEETLYSIYLSTSHHAHQKKETRYMRLIRRVLARQSSALNLLEDLQPQPNGQEGKPFFAQGNVRLWWVCGINGNNCDNCRSLGGEC